MITMGAVTLFGLSIGVLIVFYGVFTDYKDTDDRAVYRYYPDVHVMTFMGFGFLMSYLSHSGFTATSHTFLVGVFSILWAVLARGFWERVYRRSGEGGFDKIGVGVSELLGANFAAVAVLISFGALIGRLSALQLLVMATVEVFFYSMNQLVVEDRYKAADVGGAMTIHLFGAYFGLACAFVLDRTGDRRAKVEAGGTGSSTRVSDTMAMVGTLVLFCFWPSFNAGFAQGIAAQRAIVNTVLSICMSAFAAFVAMDFVHRGKFRMVEVQHATLAGGVAMGATADMVTTTYGAMIIGLAAGILSVVGFVYVSPRLERWGVHDTCGVHNLHGMPGVLGGFLSILVGRAATQSLYGDTLVMVFPERGQRSAETQAGYQIAALVTSLVLALVTGAFTGFVCSRLPSLTEFNNDDAEYVVEMPERPSTEPTAPTVDDAAPEQPPTLTP